MQKKEEIVGVTRNAFFTMSSEEDNVGDFWINSKSAGSCFYKEKELNSEGENIFDLIEYI
jgi:hypothetical protein